MPAGVEVVTNRQLLRWLRRRRPVLTDQEVARISAAAVVGALAIAVLVLYAVQTYLPTISDALPTVAAVHAVNALAVFWLAVRLARAVPWNPAPDGTMAR